MISAGKNLPMTGNVLGGDTYRLGKVLKIQSANCEQNVPFGGCTSVDGVSGSLVICSDGTYAYQAKGTAEGTAEGQQIDDDQFVCTNSYFGFLFSQRLTVDLTELKVTVRECGEPTWMASGAPLLTPHEISGVSVQEQVTLDDKFSERCAALIEQAGQLSAYGVTQVETGTIVLTDANLARVHYVSATAAATNTTCLGHFLLQSSDEAFALASGVVTWKYVLDGAAQPLPLQGQTVVERYDVLVVDGKGTSFTRTVTIAITGNPDAPTLHVVENDTAQRLGRETSGMAVTPVTGVGPNRTFGGLTALELLNHLLLITAPLAADACDAPTLGGSSDLAAPARKLLSASQMRELKDSRTTANQDPHRDSGGLP